MMLTGPQDTSTVDEALITLVETVRATGYRFITVTPDTHRRVNARPGNYWGRTLRDIFGWSRPFYPAILPEGLFELMQAAGVLVSSGGGWRTNIRIATIGDDFFLHSSYPTTDVDAVFFGPDTYRFVSTMRAHLKGHGPVRRAVDIGAGAGPGGILLAGEHPDAEVFLADINESALRLARINARLAGITNTRPVHSDLLSSIKGEFDLIVANPPFLVDAAERSYRHGGGTYGASLSLAIASLSQERLAPGGTMLLYTGVAILDGTDPIRSALEKSLQGSKLNWSYTELDPDIFGDELERDVYADIDRIAAVLLMVNKPL